jgi:uncharacterized protein
MTRKIISIFLALLLCMSLAVSASAEEKAIDFIIDEFDYLVAEELNDLNALALRIYEETGVGIFFVYTREESLKDYDVGSLTGGMENYFVMMENDESWYTVKGGLGEDIDVAAEDALRAVYDATDTYVSGVEDFLYAAAAYFPYIADTSEGDILEAEESLLFDEADLLTDSEEAALTQKLMDVSHSYNAQIVVATMASMDGGNIDFFVDYLYDSMGFGYGENHDGVLLLVCMDPREYRILSNGYAGVAINPDTIGKISDEIVVNLSGGDYAGAFDEFADECAYYLEGYLNGFPFDAGMSLVISLAIGVAVGLIVAFVLKGQLKTVRKQNQANVYVKTGSMHVDVRSDLFLYRNVTRTAKPKSNSSGSGGSGGVARSKGGGSF